jgi:hypothetical protein
VECFNETEVPLDIETDYLEADLGSGSDESMANCKMINNIYYSINNFCI